MSEQAIDDGSINFTVGIPIGMPAAPVVLAANAKLEGDDVSLAERLAAIERRLDAIDKQLQFGSPADDTPASKS